MYYEDLYNSLVVSLENVRLNGTLYGVEEPIEIADCDRLIKNGCNF